MNRQGGAVQLHGEASCLAAYARYARTVTEAKHVYWRRRLIALAGVAAVPRPPPCSSATARATASRSRPRPTSRSRCPRTPRGGVSVLPEHRVVAFYGAPQSRELGALGIGTPDGAARRLARQARPYRRKNRPSCPRSS